MSGHRRNATVISSRKQSAVSLCRAPARVCQYAHCPTTSPLFILIFVAASNHRLAGRGRRKNFSFGRSTLFSYRPRQFPARIGLNFEPAAFVIASISAASAAAAAAATSDARRSKGINSITSGQSNLTRDRIADTHKSFTGILQVAPLCTPPHLIHSFISPQNGSQKQNGNRT